MMVLNNKEANKLIEEKSPYLLQHAYNPVEWYPWGEEAFQKAKNEDKPIFLSIGYSTCHWCHVMAHESFEDSEVAELMNQTFISIKVDREERPDIDKIYMDVCQLLTGSGGWPLTIIMTPDKKPFFAGTYFPKKSRYGRIGFIELIERIDVLWKTERKKILNSAEDITFSLQNITNEAPGEKLDEKNLREAFSQLAMQFDEKYGGFGSRPKFPTPHNLVFLLRFWNRTDKKEALEMIEKTLKEMRKGGIYDHLGFGFHRYSTDEHWLVPHFEKMLYDQALLAITYIEAFLATKNEEYAITAKQIFEYVLRDMTSKEGGFYSAEDADSEGVEGKFYVWSEEELKVILNEENFTIVKETFNINKEGNFLEEATQEKTNNNILFMQKSIQELAKNFNMTESSFKSRLKEIRKTMFGIREKRIHPHKDDKILTDWNGLMIAALAKGYSAFQNKTYLDAAKKAVDFILKILYDSDGNLLHRFRDGQAEIKGYLTDHAFLIWGLIELYESTFDVEYLSHALKLNEKLLDQFWDGNIGGFYFSARDAEKLITKKKEIYDGAIPSGNSIALLNLLRLSLITGNHELEEKADILMRVFSEKIKSNPLAFTQFFIAVDFAVGPTYSVVIAGDTNAENTLRFLNEIYSIYVPNKVLIFRPTNDANPEIDKFADDIHYYDKLNDKATVYVCVNNMCKPATTESAIMNKYLNSKW